MSLKAFHLVFIVASILLAMCVGVWFLVDHDSTHNVWELLAGIGSLLSAVGLIFYERYFLKKTKDVSYL